MPKNPTRIDLLELDIDLRLTDLWREAGEVAEWNLEVVAAFMRAAYGKGYCDALTEDDPGSLCHEHGYRIPRRARPRRACPSARTRQRSVATITAWEEAQPGAARDRALGRGGARGLPALHLDRRRRHASYSPSALAGKTGRVAVSGRVVGPVRGDAHDGGLRFRLRDVKGVQAKVPVVYEGSVPDLSASAVTSTSKGT